MLAALLTLLAAAPATPTPVAPAPPVTGTSGNTGTTGNTPTLSSDVVVDALLPCGLRVLTARDMSLPVAAVVLAVESGSEDDPSDAPGLVHALAYQLLQGNRELRPGEVIAAAQDAGGLHGMATGLGQVRYESLVPATRLDAVLWSESQRLRFPTTAPQRWEQALGWAAGDEREGSRLRPEALAYVHGTPGLGHDGRAVGKSLAALVEGALAQHLAQKFNYTRATLVIVAPESPERILERVRPLFADLPATRRTAPLRRPGPRPAAAPATTTNLSPGTGVTVPLSRQRGHTFVWAVPPTPAGGAWAASVCRAINRQKKGPEPEESRKARLTCEYEADARRGTLLLRPSGADDPWAFVRARLARFAPGGADLGLLQAQAVTVAQALRLTQRTPQGLAQQLAMIPSEESTSPQPAFTRQHRIDDLTGVAALADVANVQRDAPDLLRLDAAVVLVYPEATP